VTEGVSTPLDDRTGKALDDRTGNTPAFAPRAGHTDEVLFARSGASGRVRLNRPRTINAITPAMVRAINEQLADWAGDDAVANVVFDGAGERGLCAGGDIKALYAAVREGNSDALDFWGEEYAMNATIANYRKPTIALMDGIVMGGGIGIAAYCSFRVVTATSRVAMPETIIGFFPDVGSRFLLSRAPGHLGTHLALTGATVGAGDAIAAGLADVMLDADGITELLDHLAQGRPVAECTGEIPAGELAGSAWMAECYAGSDAAAILEALSSHDDPRARETAEVLRQRCPLSVVVTLAGLRRAEHMTLVEVLDSDAVMARRFSTSPDFLEGVRAQLIDKDRQPRWQHRDVSEVSPELVADFLGTVPVG